MTKRSVPRRKRSAPAHTAPKKKQIVAAKKKHVRELVKAGLWGEIEKLYGKKILGKAKNYAETMQRVKKTPLEIAHEILVKNGYLPLASQETAISTPAPLVNMENGTSTSDEIQQVDTIVQNNTSTASTASSPKTLTKDQLKLIETRRQEALARRRRIQQAATAPVSSPIVIRPDSADHNLQSAVAAIQEHHLSPPQDSRRRTSSRPAGQSNSITHRVVTPEKTPTTNEDAETKHARPQCFWDDLEAAAEIVQWENEQMAEVAVEQLPATATNSDQEFGIVQHEVRQPTEAETPNTRPPAVVSLSQELLAAAEIIQWEKEHEVSSEVPAFNEQGDSSGSDHELEAPHFQLLPVHITDDWEQQNEKRPETVRPHDNIKSHHELQRSNFQPKSNAHRKRPLAALPSSASAISSKAAQSSEKHQRNPTPSCSSLNQRDSTTEFIDKHLLEDKLEFPVLEFLNMMLA
ncbi:unnamed protein product [Peronospora destructor]|uniref:Uncharacterized protein n=1 Tax=Peronospora destructor TaxID=86335 RepID=A0AAV0U3Z3_9STRA|nr:unnamed protein product [Peronospora destructor]